MNWATHPTIRHTNANQRALWRRQILARDKTCKINGPNCTNIATEADHVRNVAEGGDELDLNNGQGACHNCHAEKTQAEAQRGNSRWKRKPETHPGLK